MTWAIGWAKLTRSAENLPCRYLSTCLYSPLHMLCIFDGSSSSHIYRYSNGTCWLWCLRFLHKCMGKYLCYFSGGSDCKFCNIATMVPLSNHETVLAKRKVTLRMAVAVVQYTSVLSLVLLALLRLCPLFNCFFSIDLHNRIAFVAIIVSNSWRSFAFSWQIGNQLGSCCLFPS